MKEITKSDCYKAMRNLFNLKWDVNQDNLNLLIEYFFEDLLLEYNIERAERWEEEYNWLDWNARFDQRACERLLYLFQQ